MSSKEREKRERETIKYEFCFQFVGISLHLWRELLEEREKKLKKKKLKKKREKLKRRRKKRKKVREIARFLIEGHQKAHHWEREGGTGVWKNLKKKEQKKKRKRKKKRRRRRRKKKKETEGQKLLAF